MNGADWKAMGWVEYQTLLAAWNDRHTEGADKPEPDFTALRRSMAAHSVH